MLDVNVNGTFLFAKQAGQHMIEKHIKGSIIMVSSMSGVIVNRPQKQSAYNTVISPLFHRLLLHRFAKHPSLFLVKSGSRPNDEINGQRMG